jgi:hypothetical protein
MVSEKLIKLYYNKLKKPTIINGLVLHPFIVDDRIIWEVENPNDVSYASVVVEGHLEEMLYEFFELAGVVNREKITGGIDWSVIGPKYCKLSKQDVYISKETRDKINKSLENFNEIQLDDSGSILNAECFVKNWSIEYPDTESLYFHLDLELFNPNIDNKDVDDDTLQEFIESFIYDTDSSEQEQDLISEQMSILYNEKNLIDTTYMFIMPIIGYYDSFGNGLT